MIQWEAIVTSLLTAGTIQAVVTFILTTAIKKIGNKTNITAEKAEQIKGNADTISESGNNIVTVAKDIKKIVETMVQADEGLNALYTKANDLVTEKLNLLGELKETVNEYLKEQ